jgi:hypothetical protein
MPHSRSPWLGGDCLADVATLRAEPAVFGLVASDPTISRLMDTLAKAGLKALSAIRSVRAAVRWHVWQLAGANSPAADGSVTVDIDGVLVIAHSDKQSLTWRGSPADGAEARVTTLAVQCRPFQPCTSAGVLPAVAPPRAAARWTPICPRCSPAATRDPSPATSGS